MAQTALATLLALTLLAVAAGRRTPLSHLHLERRFLVVVLGQTQGHHGEVRRRRRRGCCLTLPRQATSLYNAQNVEEMVLSPLARLSAYPLRTLDCTGESLPNFSFACNETLAAAADQWARFEQCGLCVQRLLAGDAPSTHVVRVRPDVTFWNEVQHDDLPPFGSVAARVRAALGWSNITNENFAYHWSNSECDTSQACLPCNSAGPPCEVVDDQFAIMHSATAATYFFGPAAVKEAGSCYDPSWTAYPEKVLSQALRQAHVGTHLIRVQSRLTRDVLAGNHLGQRQTEVIHKNCEG